MEQTPTLPCRTGGETGVLSPLLALRPAAKLLGVCEKTVFNLVKDRKLRCVKIGRAVRFDPADLAAFIEQNKQ